MRSYHVVICLLALLVLLAPRPASAHAEFVTSTPRADAVLDAAPPSVTIIFSEGIDPAGSALTVEDTSGTRVDQDDARLDPSDAVGKTFVVSLKDGLGAGSYTVRWAAASADGHTEEGSFRFTVGASGAASASPAPATSTGASPAATAAGSAPTGDTAATLPATGTGRASLIWLIGLGIGLGALGTLLRRRSMRA